MVKVISIGNTCLDIILRYVDELPRWGTEKFCQESESRLGGQATNFAVATSKLSNPTWLVSNIGNDLIGQNFKSELRGLQNLNTGFLESRMNQQVLRSSSFGVTENDYSWPT